MIVEDIKNDEGLAEINLGNVEVITDSDIILHVIKPQEIKDIIDTLENLAKEFRFIEGKQFLEQEFTTLRTKLYTLLPHKQKRGLNNIIGTTMKWLYGTMDDNDRQNIEEHLKLVDPNNHMAISTLNRNIIISDHFNTTFQNNKKAI